MVVAIIAFGTTEENHQLTPPSAFEGNEDSLILNEVLKQANTQPQMIQPAPPSTFLTLTALWIRYWNVSFHSGLSELSTT